MEASARISTSGRNWEKCRSFQRRDDPTTWGALHNRRCEEPTATKQSRDSGSPRRFAARDDEIG